MVSHSSVLFIMYHNVVPLQISIISVKSYVRMLNSSQPVIKALIHVNNLMAGKLGLDTGMHKLTHIEY